MGGFYYKNLIYYMNCYEFVIIWVENLDNNSYFIKKIMIFYKNKAIFNKKLIIYIDFL